ncbi:peptidase S8/S53 domain-containing protein [Catenaria anguillulae PL171]|uniref:Peptidase S8/S53 domain-containing protein n=1 Tax=Catenaria anguillulae PL171 TaxID=765915 RepID=A0A1Y2HBD3_9FUNG|nr:peptidase S8/S53 domain-containing protein [Catenaria anguillulae PL171]
MKFITLFALAALAVTASAAPSAKSGPVPNRYIVTLKPTADHSTFSRALKSEVARENAREDAGGVTSEIHREYKIADSFKGFAGQFSKGLVEKLKNNPNVARIEPDHIVTIKAQQSNPPSWGLTRVGQRKRGTGPYVFPDNAGSGATVYVVDTGILTSHSDFQGRASWGFSADSSWPKTDDNGHGTHCAGTVAGRLHGVAKNAKVVAVKVLGGDGSGTDSGVIAGIDYVASEARRLGRTVVANMSLGGDYSQALNEAVAAAVEAGVVFAVAAGNESQDACNTSPASEPSAITVAASDRSDYLADFSNYGNCVDIVAPGVSITSTWNNGRTNTIDGTSMASPHVAGAAALLVGANPSLSPSQVASTIRSRSTANTIRGSLYGTPNRLLYVN